MKYIGFIKEHDEKMSEAIHFNEIINSADEQADSIKKIVNYLDKGVLLFGWMGFVYDLENEKPIKPDSYYTDGEWIWPVYFPYYLKKYPKFPVNKDFIDYLKNKNFEFKIRHDFSQIKHQLESDLMKKLEGE